MYFCCLYISVNDTDFGVAFTCMMFSCFCLNGPCKVNIQSSFMKKITTEKFLKKDLVKKAYSTSQIVKEILLYMKWVTDLRVKI